MRNSSLPEAAIAAASRAAFPGSPSHSQPAPGSADIAPPTTEETLAPAGASAGGPASARPPAQTDAASASDSEPAQASCGDDAPAGGAADASSPTQAAVVAASTPTPAVARPSVGAPPLPQVLGLTAPQRIALQAIAAGRGTNAAARLAGVDRSTLYRWRTRDENFIAAANAWHHHALQSATDKLTATVEMAVVAVTKSIRKGDVRTAITVLKSLGPLAAQRPGPRTAEAVHQTLELDAMREEYSLLKSRADMARDLYHLDSTFHGVCIGDKDDKYKAAQKKYLAALEQTANPQEADPANNPPPAVPRQRRMKDVFASKICSDNGVPLP